MHNQKNCSIQCSIKDCAHHYLSENFCTLDKISVGTHEMHPTKPECTDCESFCMRTN